MTPTSQDAQKKVALPEDSLGEPISSLNIELGRISAEIQSINSGFQAHMQQVLAETREALARHYEARLEQCVDNLREQIRSEVRNEVEQESQEEAAKRAAIAAVREKEIQQIVHELDLLAAEISKMLEDPSIELSKVMRMHTRQAELKAYLDGLRFGIPPGEEKSTSDQ
jgi:hypothetical protein